MTDDPGQKLRPLASEREADRRLAAPELLGEILLVKESEARKALHHDDPDAHLQAVIHRLTFPGF